MKDQTAIAVHTVGDLTYLPAVQVKRMVQVIQEVMRSVMKEGEHYGTIPGTNKPTLFKPGAEKLVFTFRLAPTYTIQVVEMPKGHFRYEAKCTLMSMQGKVIAEGVGCCSSMESKYRWRMGGKIPDGTSKEQLAQMVAEGQARWTKFGPKLRVENGDIEDVRNTVEKMAAKRALVAAVLNATATSDIFTQDLEDRPTPDPDVIDVPVEDGPATPPQQSAPAPQPKPKPEPEKQEKPPAKSAGREDGYRKIKAKYASKCSTCENPLKIGEEIWFNPKQKGVLCLPCGSTPEDVELGDTS